jgi:hypothetical protein
LVDRIDEVSEQPQLKWLQRPPLHFERIQRLGQCFARPQRKQWMALEEPDRLARRRLRGRHYLRIR